MFERARVIWFISLSQIIGGIFGALWTLVITPEAVQRYGEGPEQLLFCILALVLYLVVLAGGVLLLQEHILGIPISLFSQIAQVPVFALGPVSYAFVGVIDLTLYIKDGRFGITSFAEPGWSASIRNDEPFMVGINLVALFFCYYLLRARRINDHGGK